MWVKPTNFTVRENAHLKKKKHFYTANRPHSEKVETKITLYYVLSHGKVRWLEWPTFTYYLTYFLTSPQPSSHPTNSTAFELCRKSPQTPFKTWKWMYLWSNQAKCRPYGRFWPKMAEIQLPSNFAGNHPRCLPKHGNGCICGQIRLNVDHMGDFGQIWAKFNCLQTLQEITPDTHKSMETVQFGFKSSQMLTIMGDFGQKWPKLKCLPSLPQVTQLNCNVVSVPPIHSNNP